MPNPELVEKVLKTREEAVDLSNQEGAVDYNVLEKARTALVLSDCFHSLILSNNQLRDDCIPCIAAMIKDRNLIVKYDLTNCGVTDHQMTLHLVPALLRKRDVTTLVLDKNPLTDECIDSVCRLFLETRLSHLSMLGTNLSPQAGWKLANAVEEADDVVACSLPYSVGYQILDRITALLKRNELRCNLASSGEIINEIDALVPIFDSSPEEWNYLDKSKLFRYKKKKRRLALAPLPPPPPNNISRGSVDKDAVSNREHHSHTRSLLHRPSLNGRRKTCAPSSFPPLPEVQASRRDNAPSSLPMMAKTSNNTAKELLFPFYRDSPQDQSTQSNLKELLFSSPNAYAAHPSSTINSLADPKIQQSLLSLYLLSERTNLNRRKENFVRGKSIMSTRSNTRSVGAKRIAGNLPAI